MTAAGPDRGSGLEVSRGVGLWRLGEDLSPIEADPLAAIPPDRERWLAFAPQGARLRPGFAAIVEAEARGRPDVDIFYADDADAAGVRLKPGPNPALLASQDYVGAPLFVRGSTLHALGGLRRETGTAALYDLLLRAFARGRGRIARICETLLVYDGARPEPTLADRRWALEQNLSGRGLEVVAGLTPASLRVRRRFEPHPRVTLVIPTRQSRAPGRDAPHIDALLESVAESAWPMDRLQVLVGDDLEGDAAYAAKRWPFGFRRMATPRPVGLPFNYAVKMNRLWRAADTEHLVLMNDDLEVESRDWLEALMTFAVEAEVGGVGARLVLPDVRLQHAGMVGGPFGLFVHAWEGQDAGDPTYQDWALMQRDWSAVTGAVFATRRSTLQAVNGFDERFALEYNDVDLCLRLGLLGYRIVYAPDAELVHHERASRGDARPLASQTALFLRRWRRAIADDPMGHPRLARDRFALAPADGPS